MPKKPTIKFEDLGLTTPLPRVLLKSRKERKQEDFLIQKEKKERIKEALKIVGDAREDIEKHRKIQAKEAELEKARRLERQKELKEIQRIARNEREERAKEQFAKTLASQKAYFNTVLKNQEKIEAYQQKIRIEMDKKTEEIAKKAPQNVHIHVNRDEAMQEQRASLPVIREEQPIVEAINATFRTCVLICGETGSGKTTQVPQFLWECGYGHQEGSTFGREGVILVTEPRRVAAISMARRVAEELNVEFGKEVCYHVRYDNNMSDDMKVKFATEGVILKEIQSDFLLRRYSVIIVDEAHERSISCDILIGLLSRILPLRNELYQEELEANGGDPTKTSIKPLRLVIMSATMRVTDFKDNTKLFSVTPPLINVEARRFPVSNHFARRTVLKEYVDEAFMKVTQIHKKLPPGGILVFLCTQQEIEDLCQRLRNHYAKTKIEYYDNAYHKGDLMDGEQSVDSDASEHSKQEKDEYGLTVDDYALDLEWEGARGSMKRPRESTRSLSKPLREDDNSDQDEEEQEEETDAADGDVNGEYDTLHVLPLYALLDFNKQQEVFKTPPSGKRLCVVATNVAETSITIPNIKYVIDSGRVKSKIIDSETGASAFRIGWTSQASAEQRSGRAGRVGPGHCYRLYSTAVYSNSMEKHTIPEVLRTPLDSVALMMKGIGIDNVAAFPFPSPPRESDVTSALRHLSIIGAINPNKGYRITELGKQLMNYPVPPRFARILAEALDKKLSPRLTMIVTAIVSVCSTMTTIFTAEGNRIKSNKESTDDRRDAIRSLLHPGSDLITGLNAFRAYLLDFRCCHRYCLIQKNMSEARQLCHQLHREMRLHSNNLETADLFDTMDVNESWSHEGFTLKGVDIELKKEEEVVLRKLFISGLVDQVARRATIHECRSRGIDYNDKKTSKTPYIITATNVVAYVHPTSSVSKTYPPPDYLLFAFLQRTHRSESKTPLTAMMGVTIVTKDWLDESGYDEEAPPLDKVQC